MLRIAVCDDCIQTTGEIDLLVQKFGKKHYIEVEVDVYFDGGKLEQAIIEGNCYDIIYLDIEMGEKDGISTAKEIRKIDKDVILIYVTSYESYMKEAFEVHPFQFLEKPVQEDKFEKYFLEAYEEVLRCDYYFEYKYNRVIYKILVKDIIYFKSEKRTIYIYLKDEKRKMYGKLSDIQKRLQKGKSTFLRIHQSVLVNFWYIDGLSYDRIYIKNGFTLPISEDRRKEISEQYCDMEAI